MLLIFTHRHGFEADVVIDELRRRDVAFLRFNADDPGARIVLDPGSNERSYVTCDDRMVPVSQIRAGWFQQDIPSLALSSGVSSADRLAVQSRAAAFEFLLVQDHIRWLSSPGAVRAAANKPRQLQNALQVGLGIPQTRVTNDPATVAEFAASMKEGLIVKNLATPKLSKSGAVALAYTREYDPQATSPEQIAFAPLIYQERLCRKRDIRAVVVGDDIYAGAIESGHLPDIRRVPMKEADYSPYELGDDTRTQLLRLCRMLELRYASIDLVETRDGEVHFLEANATGAFLWVERMCGYPIARTLAERLESLVSA